jgi:hypothetical protein
MLPEQLLYQQAELRTPLSGREQIGLFRREVVLDLLFEVLLDFLLPSLNFHGRVHRSAIDAHAKRQRMLMLSGQRDQILIAKHEKVLQLF